MENKLLQDTSLQETQIGFFFSRGNWKSYGNAPIWMVFDGQLQRVRYLFNEIQAPGEISCSCSEDEVTTRHKREAMIFLVAIGAQGICSVNKTW